MTWPPQNTGLFEFKMACCACAPLPTYDFGPFGSQAAAEAFLASPQVAVGCVAFDEQTDGSDNHIISFAASASEITQSKSGDDGTFAGILQMRMTIPAAGTFNLDYNVTGAGIISIEARFGGVTQNAGSLSGGPVAGTFIFTVPAAGDYILHFDYNVNNMTSAPNSGGVTLGLSGVEITPWLIAALYNGGADKIICAP